MHRVCQTWLNICAGCAQRVALRSWLLLRWQPEGLVDLTPPPWCCKGTIRGLSVTAECVSLPVPHAVPCASMLQTACFYVLCCQSQASLVTEFPQGHSNWGGLCVSAGQLRKRYASIACECLWPLRLGYCCARLVHGVLLFHELSPESCFGSEVLITALHGAWRVHLLDSRRGMCMCLMRGLACGLCMCLGHRRKVEGECCTWRTLSCMHGCYARVVECCLGL